jgi:hypothetical protein
MSGNDLITEEVGDISSGSFGRPKRTRKHEVYCVKQIRGGSIRSTAYAAMLSQFSFPDSFLSFLPRPTALDF